MDDSTITIVESMLVTGTAGYLTVQLLEWAAILNLKKDNTYSSYEYQEGSISINCRQAIEKVVIHEENEFVQKDEGGIASCPLVMRRSPIYKKTTPAMVSINNKSYQIIETTDLPITGPHLASARVLNTHLPKWNPRLYNYWSGQINDCSYVYLLSQNKKVSYITNNKKYMRRWLRKQKGIKFPRMLAVAAVTVYLFEDLMNDKCPILKRAFN